MSTPAIALSADLRRRLDESTAALEAARRVERAMTTLMSARHAKQIDRRLADAIIEATPYRRAALLDPPTDAPAKLRFSVVADGLPPVEIIGIPRQSPLAPRAALHRIHAADESDLHPIHYGMIGRGAIVPVRYDGHVAALAYADAFDGSIPVEEAERALTVLVQAASLARANAALLEDRDRMISEARDLARIDPLTGLPNRAAMLEHVERELARAKRSGAPLCLAMIDVDHFKTVNDTLGHQAGDAALVGFASALRSTARDSDAVFRFAGDEFAAVIGADEAISIIAMERALAAIRAVDLAPVIGVSHPLSASIGVAQCRPDDDAATLFKRADVALYVAKNGGRNRVVGASSAPASTESAA